MKNLYLFIGLAFTIGAFAQVGVPVTPGVGVSGAQPTIPQTSVPGNLNQGVPLQEPSTLGFGGSSPTGINVNPDVNIPSPGVVPNDLGSPGQEFQAQEVVPQSAFPNTTPGFPNTTPAIPNTVPAPGSTAPGAQVPGTSTFPPPPGTNF